MRTSERRLRDDDAAVGRHALESIGLALVLAVVPELVGSSMNAACAPHAGWCGVLVLAARDGVTGMLVGVLALASTIAVGAAVTGTGLPGAWAALHTTPDLLALVASLGVSWAASWHLRRRSDLREGLASVRDRARRGEETVDALRGVVRILRARVDRTSTSLSFLRDVAERLDGPDPFAAAEAAADLALARTGASAVAVYAERDGVRRTLAVRDARGPSMLGPLVAHDAAVRVPLACEGEQFGVIALWGLAGSSLDATTNRDLETVASWCASALAGAFGLSDGEPAPAMVRP